MQTLKQRKKELAKRTEVVAFRFSKKELRQLEAHARARGLGVSSMIRLQIITTLQINP
jgi:predicted DNA binding CopG/RHH family protein